MRNFVMMAVLLAGCAGHPGEPRGALFEVYRDTSVPLSSKAVFEPARFLGTWYEVARYPVPFEAGCVGVTAEYGALPDGRISVRNTCRKPDGTVRSVIEGAADIVGPGRLKVRFASVPFVGADLWVLWADETYRTVVLGAPDGRSGWILNRDPVIPADRLAAARAMLAFNGYDLGRLMLVQP
ncbi:MULTISPECIES: lipocalin family protein [Yoonia]|nr:lipocalin family protein [Yoonia vestfoldensis]